MSPSHFRQTPLLKLPVPKVAILSATGKHAVCHVVDTRNDRRPTQPPLETAIMPNNAQIRTDITNQIVAAIESGDLPPWRKTWRCCPNSGWPVNVVSRRPYSGVNPILCMISAMRFGFASKHWATFSQWKQMKGQVKKRPDNVKPGQWGTKIVYASAITKTKTDKHGEEIEDKFFILKQYTIFNVDQVEGDHLDHLRAGYSEDTRTEFEILEHAEGVFAAT